VFVFDKCSLSDRRAEIKAAYILNVASAATMKYGFSNSILP
jgi:pectin methylesterase-like acyl-CoA thioesterase